MLGLTSDLDYGSSVEKGRWHEITWPQYDYALKNVNATNNCEWLNNHVLTVSTYLLCLLSCCTNLCSLQEWRHPQAVLSQPPSVPHMPKASRTLRHQLFSTEESGGEEILYKPPPPRDHSLHRVSEVPSLVPSSALSVESGVSQMDSNEMVSLPSQT